MIQFHAISGIGIASNEIALNLLSLPSDPAPEAARCHRFHKSIDSEPQSNTLMLQYNMNSVLAIKIIRELSSRWRVLVLILAVLRL